MTQAEALVRHVLQLAERLDGGDATAEQVDAAVDQARAIAPGATREDQLALGRALSVLEGAVRARLRSIGDELRQTGHARRAISAFGVVRPSTTSQRVRTKA